MRWRQFTPLLEVLPLRSVVLDKNARLVWLSTGTAALYGAPQADLIGARVQDHWPVGFDAAWRLTEESRLSGKVSVNVELIGAAKGPPIWLRCTRIPARGGMVLAVSEDVTDRLRFMVVERAVEQARLDPIAMLLNVPPRIR